MPGPTRRSRPDDQDSHQLTDVSKKLVIIGSVWPEPESSAAGTRMLQLIELFQGQSWDVVFASAAAPSEHQADLSLMNVEQQSIRLNCSSFDHWMVEQNPVAVVFDRFMTEEQFGWRVARHCPDALRILDTEDLHSLRAARRQLLQARQSACASFVEQHAEGPVLASPQELADQMVGSVLTLRELASIYRSDLSLMVSQYEMDLLQRQFGLPSELLHYLPLFAEPVQGPGLSFSQRADFVSIGNFRHPPNLDSVLWMKHQLWPAVRSRLPRARLNVYGAYPSPTVMALDNPDQGFLVKGRAASALEVLGAARVCLAPLRFGAGIKGKLLDAMRAGTPCVTTSLGAEAMADGSDWPGVVADDMESLVEACVALDQDEARWQAAQSRCRRLPGEKFSAAKFGDDFATGISQRMDDLVNLRRRNLVGAMLNHHQHRSTEYMSRWIELKQAVKTGDLRDK